MLVEKSNLITPASVALPKHGTSHGLRLVPMEDGSRPAHFSLRSGERELIAAALSETDGNQSRAAELLGIGRFSLRCKMKQLGLL